MRFGAITGLNPSETVTDRSSAVMPSFSLSICTYHGTVCQIYRTGITFIYTVRFVGDRRDEGEVERS